MHVRQHQVVCVCVKRVRRLQVLFVCVRRVHQHHVVCTCYRHDDDLISPCLCKGTQQFVHRSCLDHWRSVKEGFAFSHCTTCKAQFHLRVVKLNAHSWPKIKFRLFVARDVFLVFLAMQMVIGLIGGVAYIVDKNGSFKISLRGNWDLMLSTHPIPLFYCIGVFFFFVLVGFFGMVLHCLSCNNDPRVAGCQNFCFGWGMLDCFPASMEVIVILVIISVIIFAVLGLAYGFLAATMGMQRIWQRHYHILTKKELTQEYVVEDLHGCYTPPELAPEDVDRLIMFKLM
ncbi:putative E3 ubiquitin-protein ligase MARCH [Helianthus annuus]|uniref:E3 ubiquitin-protein ligase MARCH n=1 Tax=Helianthus annuus TaxID=4232 RepID=A0A9K3ITM0_HELAN|nr:putative E3 ubiquitin-protein ligase MARCH [Helianthus annuus]KAJ0567384.1 putative Zinc finger, RING-CH-type, Zinc finger, RING/FYVE/PHD-type [Helianthus annuus]